MPTLTPSDPEILAAAWHDIRVRGRLFIDLESATVIFRWANYGICSKPDPQPPDPRQSMLDLRGGSRVRQGVRVVVT